MEIGRFICQCGEEFPMELEWTKDLSHGDLTSKVAFLISGHYKNHHGNDRPYFIQR